MTTILLLAILAFQPAVQDDGYLYKITLLRAAPGRLLDVIDAYRARYVGGESESLVGMPRQQACLLPTLPHVSQQKG